MKTLGFGGMLMLCGALAACSSSSTDGAGGSGTGGGDGGGDDGSGGTTSAPSATGTTTATVTGGSPVGPGTTTGGPTCGLDGFFGPDAASCDACLLASCCAEAEACVGDQENCITVDGTIDPDSTLGGPLLACLEAECAGEDECGGGGGSGVCESGLSFGNEDGTANDELNGCLTDSCCDEFKACTADGADVNACIACLQAEGEPGELCAAALACAETNCFSDICGTGIGFGDKPVDDCLTTACCDEYTACVGTGSQADVEACLACLNDPAGGELCNAATACTTESGCVPAEM